MRRIGTLDEYHHLQFSLLTPPEVCWNMVLFMTNIENKNKEIRSIVASYAVCGNASWPVTAGNINRVESIVTGHPKNTKAALVCISIS